MNDFTQNQFVNLELILKTGDVICITLSHQYWLVPRVFQFPPPISSGMSQFYLNKTGKVAINNISHPTLCLTLMLLVAYLANTM